MRVRMRRGRWTSALEKYKTSAVKWLLPVRACILSRFSHVRLSATLWTMPGSSVRGILQARILEWVAISFSRDQTCVSYVSCTGTWEAQKVNSFLNRVEERCVPCA